MGKLTIRSAENADNDQIWEIIQKVIAKGDTYAFAPNSSREKMLAYWCDPNKKTYVALLENQVVGTFFIKDNHEGLGSHIANASYMTHPAKFGQGIGRRMGEYSLVEARKLGYNAIQFNLVVKSNERAVKLWESLGFQIIGEIPGAFNHQKLGLVNAFIMWQKL